MTVMLFTDPVANDAADYRATHHADGAAAGQDSATHSTDRETPTKPSSTVIAAAFTANFCIVFIWNASVLNIRC